MKLIRNKKLLRTVAVLMAVNLVGQIVFPTVSYALTAGPGSPEFASFEPVATTDMVSPFGGNFTYNLPVVNIPGPGGGYAMSLSYHSGVSSEQEASWVGFGWTLNPGAINRGTRGIPDDYFGGSEVVAKDEISYYSKVRPTWTATATKYGGLELFSYSNGNKKDVKFLERAFKKGEGPFGNAELASNLRYNNYKGFAKSLGITAGYKGLGTLGLNVGAAGVTFSANVNPLQIVKAVGKSNKKLQDWGFLRIYASKAKNENKGKDDKTKAKVLSTVGGQIGGSISLAGSSYGIANYKEFYPSQPTSPFTGFSYNYNFSVGVTGVIFPIGIEGGLKGSLNLTHSPNMVTRRAYGYLDNREHNLPFEGANRVDGNVASDYFLEKDSPYNKRDYFIGIPYSSPDNFSLSGEGLSGGFRFHASKVGHYYPNFSNSNITSFNLGYESMYGMSTVVGINLGAGFNWSRVLPWNNNIDNKGENLKFPAYADGEGTHPYFAKFTGDLAGTLEYGSDDVNSNYKMRVDRIQEVEDPSEAVLNQQGVDFKLNGKETPEDKLESVGRSSYIKEFYTTAGGTKKLLGFKIHNETGLEYVYGQETAGGPGATAFVRNETTMSVDVDNPINEGGDDGSTMGITKLPYIVNNDIYLYKSSDNYLVNTCKHEVATGNVKTVPYANAFMLGQIKAPDYIDVNNNGPDDADFGAWTQFKYHKKYGNNNDDGTNDWYRYRMPYTGLLYQQNEVSDTKDDLGSLTTGEKELHYLKEVETRTHKAFFVTNESTPARFGFDDTDPRFSFLRGTPEGEVDLRNDARAAKDLLTGDESVDPASKSFIDNEDKSGLADSEYLKKIILISKEQLARMAEDVNYETAPLQVTHFEYDYSLVPNTPNNIYGNYPGNSIAPEPNSSGKLTLRRVWTEYEGIKNAKISPYEFNYMYKEKEVWDQGVKDEYGYLTDFFNLSEKYTYPNEQNPPYSPHLLGPWGFNQPRGEDRNYRGLPWLYQGKLGEDEQYDPGAWHLKQIGLPSGGEILVEYEGNDYSFVHDQRAMAMVSVKNYAEGANEEHPIYELNLGDIGYDAIEDGEGEEFRKLAWILKDYFLTDKNYLYFKYLFALDGNAASRFSCKSEYISGYVQVGDVIADETARTIKIQMKGTREGEEGYIFTPRQGCFDYYQANRHGMYENGCSNDFADTYDPEIAKLVSKCDEEYPNELSAVVERYKGIKGITEALQAKSGIKQAKKENFCLTIDPENSFLRIPMHKGKRGGGNRVKRLLMYDRGIETGDQAIYGKVYHYLDDQGNSSGVATNEPSSIREENALVNFMARQHQSWLSRHIVGEDKKQTEGPLGESLLPGASIGYSRVVEENIHNLRKANGFTVHEFNTHRDYPFRDEFDYEGKAGVYDFAANKMEETVEFTNLKENRKTDYLPIPAGLFNYYLNRTWAAQGFRFITNDMSGKPKCIKTYGGDYDPAADIPPQSYLSQGQEFEYFQPGEKVRLMESQDGVSGTYEWGVPGKEMDVTMEMKSIIDRSLDFQTELDIAVATIPAPIITISVMPSFSYTETGQATHATTKVIKYPCMVKSTKTFADGVLTTTEQLAFDKYTGKPVLTASYDEYDKIPLGGSNHSGKQYNLNIPAHWIYPSMANKSLDENNLNQLQASAGSVIGYGVNGNVQFNETNKTWSMPSEVKAAQVQTFHSNPGGWFTDELLSEYGVSSGSLSDVKSKLTKIYRPHTSLVYNSEISGNDPDNENKTHKITAEGLITGFQPYIFPTPVSEGPWVKLNEVVQYSPHGNPIEEINALGIYSSAKFGYKKTKPIMVASNAKRNEIYFTDYENEMDLSPLPPNELVAEGHSGSHSLFVPNFYNQPVEVLLLKEGLRERLANEGGLLKIWIKGLLPDQEVYAGTFSQGDEMKRIAKVGEWELLEGLISPAQFAGTGTTSVSILAQGSTSAAVNIDDVRLQPKNAQATCYVYDVNTHRLLTQFDDQHFGIYFQYNPEGKLVRKIIETERGKKTIEETQSNMPVVSRAD